MRKPQQVNLAKAINRLYLRLPGCQLDYLLKSINTTQSKICLTKRFISNSDLADFTLCKAGPDGMHNIEFIELSYILNVVKLENLFACDSTDVKSCSNDIKWQGI